MKTRTYKGATLVELRLQKTKITNDEIKRVTGLKVGKRNHKKLAKRVRSEIAPHDSFEKVFIDGWMYLVFDVASPKRIDGFYVSEYWHKDDLK